MAAGRRGVRRIGPGNHSGVCSREPAPCFFPAAREPAIGRDCRTAVPGARVFSSIGPSRRAPALTWRPLSEGHCIGDAKPWVAQCGRGSRSTCCRPSADADAPRRDDAHDPRLRAHAREGCRSALRIGGGGAAFRANASRAEGAAATKKWGNPLFRLELRRTSQQPRRNPEPPGETRLSAGTGVRRKSRLGCLRLPQSLAEPESDR